jgi:hypothetical protein
MVPIRPAALALVALAAGCHGPAYSPYGSTYGSPYGQPYGTPYMQPYGGQPIQTMTPGPTYVPNGSIPGSTVPGTTIPGSMLGPTPDPNNRPSTFGAPSTGLQPIAEPNNGAPPFNGNYNPAPGAGNVPVPNPLGPSAFVPPIQRAPIASANADFGTLQPAGQTNLEQVGGAAPWSKGVPASGGENPFAPAVSDDGSQAELKKVILPELADVSPFAYDASGHKWLRGVASFDPQDRMWNLVYSDVPDQEDPLVGNVTLANHEALGGLKDGDIVLVEGELSDSSRDSRGQPTYVIRKLTAQGQSAFASQP